MAIPFYGAEDPEMFAIERAAMDRDGVVLTELDRQLPSHGLVLDVGAGDGFTAEALTTEGRVVVPIEPAEGMVRSDRHLPWVRGIAQALPFADDSFDAAYSTWAYFFPTFIDVTAGLDELRRVTKPGGLLIIVDNAGGDEFTAMAGDDIGTDLGYWRAQGFSVDIVESAFVFESVDDARKLLAFYFGDDVQPAQRVGFNVALVSSQIPDPAS